MEWLSTGSLKVVRNIGLACMAVAVGLWLFVAIELYSWLAALVLWLAGCSLVATSGLAYLRAVNRPDAPRQHAKPKARSAAA